MEEWKREEVEESKRVVLRWHSEEELTAEVAKSSRKGRKEGAKIAK